MNYRNGTNRMIIYKCYKDQIATEQKQFKISLKCRKTDEQEKKQKFT